MSVCTLSVVDATGLDDLKNNDASSRFLWPRAGRLISIRCDVEMDRTCRWCDRSGQTSETMMPRLASFVGLTVGQAGGRWSDSPSSMSASYFFNLALSRRDSLWLSSPRPRLELLFFTTNTIRIKIFKVAENSSSWLLLTPFGKWRYVMVRRKLSRLFSFAVALGVNEAIKIRRRFAYFPHLIYYYYTRVVLYLCDCAVLYRYVIIRATIIRYNFLRWQNCHIQGK